MAQRRMFSKTITNSDPFLEMPASSQNLYFHLGMNADDDGFVQARSVMKQIGANDDDLKILLTKGFLIRFADGVIVITAWKINNEIRSDRYKPTYYQEHLKRLSITDNKCYSLVGEQLVLPKDNHLDTQVRLGKDSIDKIRLDKINKEKDYVDIDIEEIYQTYPTRDWKQKYSTGKCQKNRKQIKILLKKYTKEHIISEINKYLQEQKKANLSIKTFSRFLDEFPEPEKSLDEYDFENMTVEEIEKLGKIK